MGLNPSYFDEKRQKLKMLRHELLAKQLIDASRNHKASFYLAQRISIAIQRDNTASLLATPPLGDDVEESFDTYMNIFIASSLTSSSSSSSSYLTCRRQEIKRRYHTYDSSI